MVKRAVISIGDAEIQFRRACGNRELLCDTRVRESIADKKYLAELWRKRGEVFPRRVGGEIDARGR